jgi:hypothetical protein
MGEVRRADGGRSAFVKDRRISNKLLLRRDKMIIII